MQVTARTPAVEECPPDIVTMRASTHRALVEGPSSGELDALTLALRGHIQLLIPEVQKVARLQPRDSVPRLVALLCCDEALRKLRIGDGANLPVRVAVAQKLARCVNALCNHYVRLGGAS